MRENSILGVRFWQVSVLHTNESSNIQSMIFAHPRVVWSPGEVMEARCLGPEFDSKVLNHPAPQPYCDCGLYAFYNHKNFEEHGNVGGVDVKSHPQIVGLVAAGGDIVHGEYGFKSQYMTIKAIIRTEDQFKIYGKPYDIEPAYQELAARYGVPVINKEDIESFALLENLDMVSPDPYNEHEKWVYEKYVASGYNPVAIMNAAKNEIKPSGGETYNPLRIWDNLVEPLSVGCSINGDIKGTVKYYALAYMLIMSPVYALILLSGFVVGWEVASSWLMTLAAASGFVIALFGISEYYKKRRKNGEHW